jgi:hypothetical protein
MSNAARSGENEDVFGNEDTDAMTQAAQDIAETGGTQYEVGKGGRRRGRKKATLRKVEGDEAERDPADQAEINRLADEQRKDDVDPREQGPPETGARDEASEERESDPDLDNWKPLDDTAIGALRPYSRRLISDGMIENLVRLVAQVKKDAKRLGFPYADDLKNVAKLATAIGELSSNTGLDLDAKSSD